MPIPPRPIPTTPAYHRRGATRPSPPLPSAGRKGASDAFIAESRAEMALLPGLSVGSTPSSLRGVRLMHAATLSMAGSAPSSRSATPPTPPGPASHTHQATLASLMEAGRTARPKRVGAASQLGFDFVPRPNVLAMSEDTPIPPPQATAPQPVDSPRSSFWPWTSPSANTSPASSLPRTASAAAPIPSASAAIAHVASSLPVPLSTPSRVSAPVTAGRNPGLPPSTPGLDPSTPDDHVEDAEDDDDDWEHVCAVEDDHIVGELELDDEYAFEEGKTGAGGGPLARSAYATVAAVRNT